MRYFLALLMTIFAVGTSYGQQTGSAIKKGQIGAATSTSMGLVQYNYQELDPSSSGTISAAQPVMHLSRVNEQVNLSFNSLGHGSSATASTAAGFIPVGSRPPFTVVAITSMTATQVMLSQVAADGTVSWAYRDWAGGTSARTSTPSGSISWTVDN